MRTVLILLAIIAAVVIIKRLVDARASNKARSNQHKSTNKIRFDKTVQCQHCGVHLPADSAINADGIYFCSEKHQQQWRELNPPGNH